MGIAGLRMSGQIHRQESKRKMKSRVERFRLAREARKSKTSLMPCSFDATV